MNPNYELAQRLRELNGSITQYQAAELLGISQANVSACCKAHNIIWIWQRKDQNGIKNHAYKDGMGRSTIERLTRKILIEEGRDLFTCERCEFTSHTDELPRHHKDRDRSNNTPTNIEVICQSCHTKEHNQDKPRGAGGRFV